MELAVGERESQYRSIVESTGDGVLVTDLTNAVVAANPAFCTLAGYTPEQLRTIHPREFLHLDDLQSFDAYLARTATTELIKMSRLRTWPNSWARTPYTSSSSRIWSRPWLTQIAACEGLRPVAKAFGDGSGLT